MNNVKYYNDSLAYDFEMFMPKPAGEKRQRDNVVKLPQNRTMAKSRSAARQMSASVFSVMSAVFIMAAVCGNIALRLQINEVNTEVSNMRASISELDSVKTQLEMDFQRKISYKNIEVEAAKLGMKKMSRDQVTYIRVNDKDSARTADGNIVTAE